MDTRASPPNGDDQRRQLGVRLGSANVSFSATLNGADQTVSSPQALDVSDATGSGAGWDITATSTTFTGSSR